MSMSGRDKNTSNNHEGESIWMFSPKMPDAEILDTNSQTRNLQNVNVQVSELNLEID